MGAIETAGIVAIALGLMEVVKILVAKIKNGNGKKSNLAQDERDALMKIKDALGDGPGALPRAIEKLHETQEKVVDAIRDSSTTTILLRKTMERLERKLEDG